MLDAVSKQFFHGLARSHTLERLAFRYGMARPTSFARRFIPGEHVKEAIAAGMALQNRGMSVTLDMLGESVTTLVEADRATREYLEVFDEVVHSPIDRNISVKLTQLGLALDRAVCTDNIRRLLDAAARQRFFVRLDMENSPFTDDTLAIFDILWQQGYRNTGVVLQSALMRSERDLDRMLEMKARVRLVKGAYQEPKTIAYNKKSDVDVAFRRMMARLLLEGHYPAIATHDPAMLEEARRIARDHAVLSDRFEFQMLYGIRRDLQAKLVQDGFRVRIYLPFGRQWFPYFMRRLGERPANVRFVLRGILEER